MGVASLDDDHKQMFAIVRTLHSAMSLGRGASVVHETIGNLVDHARSHFAAEEALMEKAQYLELGSHRREYEEILRKLEELERTTAGSPVSPVTVAEFVDKWLRPHTLHTDQKYSEHLNAKGIS